ncbi:hypothetical protein TgHK011_000263 [Trichoderma gracile]|nr:hypothetical protein TgHK011_000263 [Trichoderma gracile]
MQTQCPLDRPVGVDRNETYMDRQDMSQTCIQPLADDIWLWLVASSQHGRKRPATLGWSRREKKGDGRQVERTDRESGRQADGWTDERLPCGCQQSRLTNVDNGNDTMTMTMLARRRRWPLSWAVVDATSD